MHIEMISTSNEEVSDWLNRGKDVLVEKLVRDGVVTREQGDQINGQYMLSIQQNKRLTKKIREFLGIANEANSTIICSKL